MQLAQTQNSDITLKRYEFANEERLVLQFWKEIKAFETQMELTKDMPRYTFFDGPPFATGLPHYGHLLTGTIKDTVTRYAAQTGHYVERRAGWDCHGLPVEYEIDKKLNIKNRSDVMQMGIAEYNKECRSIVMRYSKEWRHTVERMGRWIDFDNDYKTLDPSFMESVWWVFKQLFEKDQVYLGFKVMPFSTACGTPLSNFEANQNYKDVLDPAVTVSFPLVDQPDVSLLAWTTTPWTLVSNLALCVHPEFEYVQIKDGETGAQWILLEARLSVLYKDIGKAKFDVVKRWKGAELVGLKYQPLFEFLSEGRRDRIYRVVSDTYVTNDSGTGIVHQAPGFGEDDYRVGIVNGIILKGELGFCPVDESGCYTSEIVDYAGLHVKDKETDKKIIKKLKTEGRIVRNAQLNHSYPFCWRSDTPLIYKAVPCWFVKVESIVPQLLKNNLRSHWVPDFVQEKRFANWLGNARDWAVSRNRYWGTPIPLWASQDMEEIVAVGSVEELEKLSGVTGITDLHRESIDHITIPSTKGKGVLKRVEEVFDCWFESGSMPYAQIHYPFENKEVFDKTFPADFIAEGLDQTRGWFYTLLVLSTHLFDKPAFKNLVVNGLVLAADGKKMSKRLKNYPEPTVVIDQLGADALRLYLINSPVVKAETLKFKEEGVRDVSKDVLSPWVNSYKFFLAQVHLLKKQDNFTFTYDLQATGQHGQNKMDRWILGSIQQLIQFVREEMAAYRLYTVVPRLLKLIENLTNWYIKFNRKRLKGGDGLDEAQAAMRTLFEVLYTLVRAMAPFTPFLCENMYQGLRKFMTGSSHSKDIRSVHFLEYPTVRKEYFDDATVRAVELMQRVVNLGRQTREAKIISLRQPLSELVVLLDASSLEYETMKSDLESMEQYIKESLNVNTVTLTTDEAKYGVKYQLMPDQRAIGQKYRKDAGRIRKALEQLTNEEVKRFTDSVQLLDGTVTLTKEEVQIKRYFDKNSKADGSTGTQEYESNFENDLLILLDCALTDPQLVMLGLAREWQNRVQRTRRKMGFVPTDDIEVQYRMIEDVEQQLAQMLLNEQCITETIKVVPTELKAENNVPLVEAEECEVNGSSFWLYLVKK